MSAARETELPPGAVLGRLQEILWADTEKQVKLFVALVRATQRGLSPCTLRLPIRSASIASREATRTI